MRLVETKMFIEYIEEKAKSNKYTTWYINIIKKAKNRNQKVLGEIHHIVPKCFKSQWSKEPGNLVLLTYREHYICHALLIKMFDGVYHHKAVYSLNFITGKHKYEYMNSHIFAFLKRQLSEFNSSKRPEIAKKISNALKGRTAETHDYIRIANEKRKWHTAENNENVKLGREKWKIWFDGLSDEEKYFIFYEKDKEVRQKNHKEHSIRMKGRNKENNSGVRKMAETKRTRAASMTEEERKEYYNRTGGMHWYHNDNLKLTKLLKPEDAGIGWNRGRIRYD